LLLRRDFKILLYYDEVRISFLRVVFTKKTKQRRELLWNSAVKYKQKSVKNIIFYFFLHIKRDINSIKKAWTWPRFVVRLEHTKWILTV